MCSIESRYHCCNAICITCTNGLKYCCNNCVDDCCNTLNDCCDILNNCALSSALCLIVTACCIPKCITINCCAFNCSPDNSFLWENNDLLFYCGCSNNTIVESLQLQNSFLPFIPWNVYKLTNILRINLSENQLKCIPPEIGKLIHLQNFYACENHISEIADEFYDLINLQTVKLDYNNLTQLSERISNLQSLAVLNISHNSLSSLPNSINQMRSLRELDISSNNFTNFPQQIMTLELDTLSHTSNPFENIPPNVTEYLNRFSRAFFNYNRPVVNNSIYTDAESVHNSNVQKCIRESIARILVVEITVNNVLAYLFANNKIDVEVKLLLLDYCKGTEHYKNQTVDVTYEQLLKIVLSIIETKPNKDDIFKIMNDEIRSSKGKCFTGRISKLLNVLTGNDERVIIHIADNEQIGNIVINERNKLLKNNQYTVEKHKEVVEQQLMERDYDEETIKEYVDCIE